jgi:hypothetical protein
LAARQELKLKAKETKNRSNMPQVHVKLSLPVISYKNEVCSRQRRRNRDRAGDTIDFVDQTQGGRRQFSSNSQRQLATTIHLQPGNTSNRPQSQTRFLATSCDIWMLVSCVMVRVSCETGRETQTQTKQYKTIFGRSHITEAFTEHTFFTNNHFYTEEF